MLPKSSYSFRGLRILVVGLGRFGGGVGVTKWLVRQGAIVTVTDQADESSLRESIAAIQDCNIRLRLGGHDLRDLDDADLVILNPAVNKSKSEFFQAIERRGIPWTTEMNLFCERCPTTVIGVTGTYGKSTTCAMLADALEACRTASHVHATDHRRDADLLGLTGTVQDGFRLNAGRVTAVRLGGNIGKSLLGELDVIRETDLVVLEMSNAQLEDLSRIGWSPAVAVITNLFPHHLDRHGSFEAYIDAKLNILRGGNGDTRLAIIGELHPEAELHLEREKTKNLRGAEIRFVRVREPNQPIPLRVPGRHNAVNAACVETVCRELGCDGDAVRGALQSFQGLPHRLQYVRTIDGVNYVNDSKSTSPSATVVAVEAVDPPIVLIVGGQKKDVSLTDFAEIAIRRCRAVICTGECGPDFARAMEDARRRLCRTTVVHAAIAPRIFEVTSLDAALSKAGECSRPGDVVLFSPGAPSFDQYGNFTERGDHFVRLVLRGNE